MALVGSRFDATRKAVCLTSQRFPTREQNELYLRDLMERLRTEAKRADPATYGPLLPSADETLAHVFVRRREHELRLLAEAERLDELKRLGRRLEDDPEHLAYLAEYEQDEPFVQARVAIATLQRDGAPAEALEAAVEAFDALVRAEA